MVKAEDYIDRDADSLIGVVDILGLVGDFIKGGLVGVMSLFIGLVLATREQAVELLGTLEISLLVITDKIVAPTGPAINEAQAAIAEYQLFGLPAGVVSATAALAAVAAVGAFLVWGFGD